MKSNDPGKQVGGTHYSQGPEQHWDYVEVALDGRYLEGNLTKYVYRHRKKNGLQDLLKAEHYLDKLIESATVGRSKPMPMRMPSYVQGNYTHMFCATHGMNTLETQILRAAPAWRKIEDLQKIKLWLAELIIEARSQLLAADRVKVNQPAEASTSYTNQD